MSPQVLADQIFNDAISTLANRAKSISPNHRATLRKAAEALARIAIRRMQPGSYAGDSNPANHTNAETLAREELAARAILSNLRATGHMLAANALRDALATALRTTASAIARL